MLELIVSQTFLKKNDMFELFWNAWNHFYHSQNPSMIIQNHLNVQFYTLKLYFYTIKIDFEWLNVCYGVILNPTKMIITILKPLPNFFFHLKNSRACSVLLPKVLLEWTLLIISNSLLKQIRIFSKQFSKSFLKYIQPIRSSPNLKFNLIKRC